MQAWRSFVLKEKLNRLKAYIKVWSKENYDDLEGTCNECRARIESLDLKAEQQGLSEEDVLEKGV